MSQNVTEIYPSAQTVMFLTVTFGATVWDSAAFHVSSTQEITLRMETMPVPPFGLTFFGIDAKAPAVYPLVAQAHLWFSYTAPSSGTMGDVYKQDIIVRCLETDQTFMVTLFAVVTSVPFLATMLVLDKSGSMEDLAGNAGFTRIEALRQATEKFIYLTPWENYVGVISFSDEAQPEAKLTFLTEGDYGAVEKLNTTIKGLVPWGDTAIGKGVALANKMLAEADLGKDYGKLIVVFTDGIENVTPYIDQVIKDGNATHNTYAIGLGTAQQVSVDALTKLTTSTGGYCLLTGQLTEDTEDYFRLIKYFTQILLEKTGKEVADDPSGIILPGQVIRVPYRVSEADYKNEVVLLTDLPVVSLEIETPAGVIINQDGPGVSFGKGPNLRYCRMSLPLKIAQGTAYEGMWHALLQVDTALYEEHMRSVESSRQGSTIRRGIRYCLSVYPTSNLRMKAQVNQRSFLPGDAFNLRVVLTEYGVPVEGRATTKAQIRRPDGTTTTVSLVESEPGIAEATVPMMIPGDYQVHILSSGKTFSGHPFTREKLLTASVFHGGEHKTTNDQDRCCQYTRRLFWLVVVLSLWVLVFGILFLVWLLTK